MPKDLSQTCGFCFIPVYVCVQVRVRRLYCVEQLVLPEEDDDEEEEPAKTQKMLAATADLRRSLLERGLVDENHRHIDVLQDLCQKVSSQKKV